MVWMVGSFVAIAMAVLTVAAVTSVISNEPIAEESSVVLPIFGGGPIHPGGWEERHAGYGDTFRESAAGQSASGYGRSFGETAHQRG
jgi:hypothetical protein